MSHSPTATAAARLVDLLTQLDGVVSQMGEVEWGEVPGTILGEASLALLTARRRIDFLAATAVERFDSSGEWGIEGSRTATGWLFGQCTDALGALKGLLDAGQVAAMFPAVGAAFARGEISARHLELLGKVHDTYPRLRTLLADADAAIADLACACQPRMFAAKLSELCHRLDPAAVDEVDAKRQHAIHLHASTLLDGYVRVDGLLPPEVGTHFLAMLESARRAVKQRLRADGVPAGDDIHNLRTTGQRNVEALKRILDLAATTTGEDGLPTITGQRPIVNVTIPLDALVAEADAPGQAMGWLERFGVPQWVISAQAVRTMACDAHLRPLIVDRTGQLVAVLPTSRTIPAAIRRAVLMRDQHCRFPRCTGRIDEVHHIVFHSHGGPTTMSNLAGLCWYHHHLVHRERWRIDGDPGGDLRFEQLRR